MKRRCLFAPASLLLLLSVAACGDDSGTGAGGAGGAGGGALACTLDATPRPEDDAPAPPISTPRWAFRPWISKDISTGADTRSFVEGFQARDIPVGVVVLDSPWETNYNTFVPNPERYPDFEGLVADLRADDIRLVLWATQMINASSRDLEPTGDLYDGPSPHWDPALGCGYFVNDGRVYQWWKGAGSALDFFDPEARAFWHRLQDPLLDLGIAGFKLDFGENYIEELPISTDDGEKSLQEYSEAYYEDFYRYGSARLGTEEFVTMVRPYDKSYQFEGRFFARPEHAPIAWVGDNRRDYIGMRDAIDHIFRSALEGYVVVGSDLGGYLDRDDVELTMEVPADAQTFMRWTGLSAMTPFMQLHGRANLEPWSYPEQTELVTDTYRFWAKLHDELVPFFDSVAIAQYAGEELRMIEPVGDEADWPTDARYWLGGALLVAPVTDALSQLDVELPGSGLYYSLFDPTGTPLPGGATFTVDVSDPSRIPVFVREGAIIPMEVGDDFTGFGTAASLDHLTLLVYPSDAGSSFDVRANDDSVELSISATTTGAGASLMLGGHPRPLLLRVATLAPPAEVAHEGAPLVEHATREELDAAASGYFVDGGYVWVKLAAEDAGLVTLE